MPVQSSGILVSFPLRDAARVALEESPNPLQQRFPISRLHSGSNKARDRGGGLPLLIVGVRIPPREGAAVMRDWLTADQESRIASA